jgi:hypothetical protein
MTVCCPSNAGISLNTSETADTHRLNAEVLFREVRRKLNFAQFGIENARGQLYTCGLDSPAEIQTPKHWNPMGRSVNVLDAYVIAQQYSSTTFV